MVGDYEKARAMGINLNPALFAANPEVDPALAFDAVLAAHISDQLGDHGQARRILTDVLAVTAPKPQIRMLNERRLVRVMAYSVLGDKERAIAELQAAKAEGYRTLYDMNAWIRVDRYPMMANIRGDPRVQAILADIEADNTRMRGALLAGSPKT